MRSSGLNTNKQRRNYWLALAENYTAGEISTALSAIQPTCAQVLIWHYREGRSFSEIKDLIDRSISTVRNHHSRGMFELQRYFMRHNMRIR